MGADGRAPAYALGWTMREAGVVKDGDEPCR